MLDMKISICQYLNVKYRLLALSQKCQTFHKYSPESENMRCVATFTASLRPSLKIRH